MKKKKPELETMIRTNVRLPLDLSDDLERMIDLTGSSKEHLVRIGVYWLTHQMSEGEYLHCCRRYQEYVQGLEAGQDDISEADVFARVRGKSGDARTQSPRPGRGDNQAG